MEKELIKKAVNEAEESLKDKQIQEVKKIVLKTLEKIDSLDKQISSEKSKLKELATNRLKLYSGWSSPYESAKRDKSNLVLWIL